MNSLILVSLKISTERQVFTIGVDLLLMFFFNYVMKRCNS